MVSVSGLDVKFGRILAVILLVVGFVILYKHYGTNKAPLIGADTSQQQQQQTERNSGRPNDNDSKNTDDGEKSKPSGSSPKILALEINKKTCSLTYLQVSPDEPKKPNKNKVLLLHGQKFSASTWDETGTMAKLKDWGYKAVALDLKYEDELKKCVGDSDSFDAKAELIHQVVVKLNLSQVVLVSPSKSGELSIPYIMNTDYGSEIAAYIPIAPVIDGKKYTEDMFKNLKQKKVLIVQGSNDKGLGVTSEKLLKNIPESKSAVIPNAGHACYKDNSEAWHDELKKFLETLQHSLEPTV